MPSFRSGVVSAVLSEREGLQRVLVGERQAYVLTDLVGRVAVGDRVVVNTTAVDLGLGTGGWDVVHWNLARTSWSDVATTGGPAGSGGSGGSGGPGGGVMKLRYTSLQTDVGAAEDDPAYDGGADLAGRPVVACTLHSQVPGVAGAVRNRRPDARIAYLMTDTAALPLALSDLVADLCRVGWLDLTLTAGQAFGGDFEVVNVRSGLGVAAGIGCADVIVVGPGPGVVGTGSTHGFSGLEVAGIVDAADRAGGRPIVALRVSDVDPRPRHRGVSHHSLTALAEAHAAAVVPIPRGEPRPPIAPPHAVIEVDIPDIAALAAAAGINLASMGRGPVDDPRCFTFAAAAGAFAADLLEAMGPPRL